MAARKQSLKKHIEAKHLGKDLHVLLSAGCIFDESLLRLRISVVGLGNF